MKKLLLVIALMLTIFLIYGFYRSSKSYKFNQILKIQAQVEQIIEKHTSGNRLKKEDCETLHYYIDLLEDFELKPIDSVRDRIEAAIGINGDCSDPF